MNDRFIADLASGNAVWCATIGLGALIPRWSAAIGGRYWSQGCPTCDALFGDFFVTEAFRDLHANGNLEDRMVTVEVATTEIDRLLSVETGDD